MKRSHFTRQPQFISKLTNNLQDFIGTHITRNQLQFLSESNHPFHRLNYYMHLITFFKLHIPSLMIAIRLLPTIGHLKPVSKAMYFLESLINQIGTKTWSLTHFKQFNMIPTAPTVQGFTRSHGDGLMKAIIIRKLHQRKMIKPITLEFNNTRSKHILKGLNSTFYFTIHLGMKNSTQLHLSTQTFMEWPPKPRCELCTPIRYDG